MIQKFLQNYRDAFGDPKGFFYRKEKNQRANWRKPKKAENCQ